jgi:nicotinamide-nucleotide amidase
MNAELINIGEELLLGLTENTHAAYLGRKLAEIGLGLERQVLVGDSMDAIAGAVGESLARSDLVITTGGMGPTSDDKTVEAVAALLGLELRTDRDVERGNEKLFRRLGKPLPNLVARQARVPEGAQVLLNEHGTAPGLVLKASKPYRAKWLVILPGPPRELQPMFEKRVLPILEKEYPGRRILEVRVLRVADLGESLIQERVEEKIRAHFPGVGIAYSARPGEVDFRLVTENRTGLADQAARLAREILGNDVFGNGDEELEAVVIGLLRKAGRTAATAESCTGGALANRFTNTPGASDVFLQGWVTYCNESKSRELGVTARALEIHGAVSEQTAREMAEGARKRSGADYALSVTGIAGPDGGTEQKPVGTVFIGLASTGETRVYKECYPMDRWTFKWRVAQRALNLLRLELLSKKVP